MSAPTLTKLMIGNNYLTFCPDQFDITITYLKEKVNIVIIVIIVNTWS